MSLDHRLPSYGVLTLRVALGAMYLAHSLILKLMTYGLPGTAAYFVSVGLPGWLAYATFGAEAVGGLLLVLGVWTRWVTLTLTLPLIGAIVWVHGGNGWLFTAPGGGWEYPAFLIMASVALVLIVPGGDARRETPDIHHRAAACR